MEERDGPVDHLRQPLRLSPRARGLVHRRISAQVALLTRDCRVMQPSGRVTGGGRRGRVDGLGAARRRRLLVQMRNLPWAPVALITLTVGRRWPSAGDVWKHWLRAYIPAPCRCA